MKTSLLALLAAGAAFGATPPASAAIIWADLTDAGAGTVTGTVGNTTVAYSGDYQFAQTSGGTDFWNTASKSSWNGASVVPGDLIALTTGGMKTIDFGRVVNDVYIALLSWNGNVASFSEAFTVESPTSGALSCGYWGCGTATVSADNKTFTGNGEFHGILKFSGPISSLSFLDTSEYWHGIQIGIGSRGPLAAPVATHMPEPTTWGMMILGMALVGAAMRRGRRPTVRVRYT
jgi:hypothetical protein